MADSLLPLNPATLPGGKIEDVEEFNIPTPAPLPPPAPGTTNVIRQRLQVSGATLAEIASVLNTLPLLSAMGLVVRVAGNRAESATVSGVAQNVASVVLLAANPAARIGVSVFNNAAAALYVKAGAAASTADFSVKILPGGYWEAPAGYSGELTGIWDAAGAGTAQVTEYT